MAYTQEDRVLEKLMPAIRASRPASEFLQRRAVARAITRDGYLDPIAVLPGSTVVVDFDSSSTTASSSDTANYTAYLSTVIHLAEGVWRFKARGALTGWLSGTSSMNTQVTLNSTVSGNFQIPLTAGDMGTVFPRLSLDEAEGDVTLQVMYRPSAGTLTIEAGEWLYRAERIG